MYVVSRKSRFTDSRTPRSRRRLVVRDDANLSALGGVTLRNGEVSVMAAGRHVTKTSCKMIACFFFNDYI